MKKRYKAVIIGGSAGGIDGVMRILRDLSPGIPIPIFIVLHRLKNVYSHLDQILGDGTGYTHVKDADEKESIQPYYAYLAPVNYHLLFEEDHTFSLDVSEQVNYSRPSIDVSFESAAALYRGELLGILLSGANSDGAKGMHRIREYGGYTIVEDPATAYAPTMPQAALDLVEVHKVVKKEDIAFEVKRLI